MLYGWRLVGLAAVLGLLGSAAAGLALADVQPGATVVRHPDAGSGALPPASPPQNASTGAGLQLLQQAAAACEGTSYSGEQVVLWWGQGETSSSVVEVWHQTGGVTLVQAAGPAPATPGSVSRAPAADNQDPDGILGVSDRLLALLKSNYQVVYAGRGSADHRAALVVDVRRPGGGLAARFWLDAATKLPLRREIFAGDTRMISEDSFTSLQLGPSGLATMPAPAAAPWAAQLDHARLGTLRAKGWPLPAQMPGNLVLFAATERSASSGPVIDVSYSDGLDVVSLFVQRGLLARSVPGWEKITVDGHAVYSVNRDERSFAWSANGFVYTMVADAPMATVRQVVSTMPGTARPPGFWQRIAHGLHRLVSWLNPFALNPLH
jgi:sigma-E factor negative regulatory protein RseB